MIKSLLALACAASFGATLSAQTLDVADFGALPDDGQCDAQAIAAAIAAAKARSATEIRFAAGVYNLTKPVAKDYYIGVFDAQNLTFTGAVDAPGAPATRLERNLELNNDTTLPLQLSVRNARGIAFRNFIFANNPPLGSTARVLAVDAAKDEVLVEVLPGLPAYDGMRCASAHAWNLETGKLKRFGHTPQEATLTIGLDIKAFWRAVPESDARRLTMTGAGFAKKVAIGDGISWHHKSAEMPNQTSVMYSRDIVFENILMPNVSNMGMIAGFNHNLTFRRVRFEPENGNLAIGGRDGLHLSNNSGELLIEDCVFKGLRMDPLVLRRSFGLVQEVKAPDALLISPGYDVPVGDRIRFWVGDEPVDKIVKKATRQKGGYLYVFEGATPAGTTVGTAVSFQTFSLTKGVIRNTLFAENFGSAIVNFEENITVEGCTFDNNSYQVKFGPNAVSGGFVRNNVVRNNVFLNTSWIDIAHRRQPATIVIHSLSRYFKNPRYNGPILITGNVFKNPDGPANAVAVDVRNAEGVEIRDNVYEGFATPVLRDGSPAEI